MKRCYFICDMNILQIKSSMNLFKGLNKFKKSSILLEDENEVVAGIFYDLQKSLSSVYILLAVTNDGHRKKGIYKKMHSLIDIIGKSHGRVGVTSFMGLDNDLLTDTIARTVGYKPIFQVMHRPIKK